MGADGLHEGCWDGPHGCLEAPEVQEGGGKGVDGQGPRWAVRTRGRTDCPGRWQEGLHGHVGGRTVRAGGRDRLYGQVGGTDFTGRLEDGAVRADR